MFRRLLWGRWLVGLVLSALLVGCGAEVQPTVTLTVTNTSIPTNAPKSTPTTPASQATTRVAPTHTSTPAPQATTRVAPTHTSTPEATATPTVTLTSIGDIGSDQLGEEVTVQGRVAETASFSEGFKFTLEDETGRIVILLWHEIYDDCWDAAVINLGGEVRATGRVSQYEGELQLQPEFGGDVKAITEATAWGAYRSIGDISGADVGQRLMIEGQVIRVEGMSSAVKVFLGDTEPTQGEILILIWRNVLDRIENNTGLGIPGSRVIVVGTVELYQGNLEVVPTLPNDVTVLEVPSDE